MAGAVTGRVVEMVPPEVILEHVDVDAMLDQVDVNHLLDRIDVDRLLARVDINALLGRVDLDALLDDVQLDALVRRAGIPDIVSEASGHLAGTALDSARRQLVGVDTLASRATDRALRRRQPGPKEPAAADTAVRRQRVSGRNAGTVSRAAAALVDLGFVMGSYAVLVALVEFMGQAFLDVSLQGVPGLVASIALLGWAFVYVLVTTTITGRTIGKGLAGLKITRKDGAPLRPGGALLRVVTFPLSTSFFGIGLLLIVVHPRHRALHDLLAGTVVVYDWGDRPAELPAPLTAYLRDRAVS